MPKPRKKSVKSVKNKLWIYTEGKKTEQYYIKGYIQDKHSTSRRVEYVSVEDVKQNTAESLIKRIKTDKACSDHKKGDIYWVAYDRESTQKYEGHRHQKALDAARGANINVALSNVCVEQYLLWHFSASQASYTSYDNLIAKSNLKKYLAGVGIDNYEKGDPLLYDKLKNKVDAAKANSEKVNKCIVDASAKGKATPIHELSPYSDFYKLLNAIDEFVAS
ncbi:RloB family protein [Vibrio coralliilyticus]|uniref:RloB family protein n=1 Tax=Vibrio coralliilyticus TaxID=190893 RepID=UPI0017F63F7F|nr:RloB family protein [Vibrio coralliilyticus]NUW69558.1 RloB domain-containing protein [Vibrio coralliilyticus]